MKREQVPAYTDDFTEEELMVIEAARYI